MRVGARIVRAFVVLVALGAGLVLCDPRSGASIFGEENVLLADILSQSVKSTEELRTISDAVGEGAAFAGNLVDAYQRVNAGIDELEHYSVDAFLHDFKGDVYHLYPGLAKLEGASARLGDWDRTHTSSPLLAYEAVSALAGDLSAPLRDDVKTGRRSIDRELILESEAAGGFALADVSETSTRAYDREIAKLRDRYEAKADPGTAAMVAAHTNLLIAEQNSHIIRFSRGRCGSMASTRRSGPVSASARSATRTGGRTQRRRLQRRRCKRRG